MISLCSSSCIDHRFALITFLLSLLLLASFVFPYLLVLLLFVILIQSSSSCARYQIFICGAFVDHLYFVFVGFFVFFSPCWSSYHLGDCPNLYHHACPNRPLGWCLCFGLPSPFLVLALIFIDHVLVNALNVLSTTFLWA